MQPAALMPLHKMIAAQFVALPVSLTPGALSISCLLVFVKSIEAEIESQCHPGMSNSVESGSPRLTRFLNCTYSKARPDRCQMNSIKESLSHLG